MEQDDHVAGHPAPALEDNPPDRDSQRVNFFQLARNFSYDSLVRLFGSYIADPPPPDLPTSMPSTSAADTSATAEEGEEGDNERRKWHSIVCRQCSSPRIGSHKVAARCTCRRASWRAEKEHSGATTGGALWIAAGGHGDVR